MDKREICEEMKMSYDELLRYLLNKYGGAICDYFYTPDCRSKNRKVTRTKEGIYCHHMDEDKGVNLGKTSDACRQPFEWQKKERLVYCNALEHLILHMKIAIVRQKDLLETSSEIGRFFNTGGIYQISHEINDMYMQDGTTISWKKRCFGEIANNYGDYIELISAFMHYIEKNYLGEKKDASLLRTGNTVHFPDGDFKILGLSDKHDKLTLKLPTGNKTFYTRDMPGLKYADCIDLECRDIASGFEEFYESIYNDIINCPQSESVNSYTEAFSVDFKGHGFAQFADINLGEDFGSKNADIYIAKALPMFCKSDYSILNKQPIFWKGKKIPQEAKNAFYIVRIKAQFNIKSGEKPFIRYREYDLMRRKMIEDITESNNLRDEGYIVLSTSDVYDKKTGQYYSKYYNMNGKLVDADVILSLGRDDYKLFHSFYDISKEVILDGCYFL